MIHLIITLLLLIIIAIGYWISSRISSKSHIDASSLSIKRPHPSRGNLPAYNQADNLAPSLKDNPTPLTSSVPPKKKTFAPKENSNISPFSVGDKCYLYSGCNMVPVSIAEVNLDELTKVSLTSNTQRMKEMIEKGIVFLDKDNTSAEILEVKPDKIKIKITSGSHSGKSGWLSTLYILTKINH